MLRDADGRARYADRPDSLVHMLRASVQRDRRVADVVAVVAHCRTRLVDFKCPQYVAVLSQQLPRNPGGKVLEAQPRDETDWGPPLRWTRQRKGD